MAEIRLSSGQSGQQWRDLSQRLKQAGAVDLRKQLRKEIQAAGKPVVAATADAARHVPIRSERSSDPKAGLRFAEAGAHGGGQKQRRKHKAESARTEKSRARALARGGSLRETVAQAVKLQITARGIRIVMDSKQLPEKQNTLGRRLDSEKGWRHPVFGNREVWVTQKGAPWFGVTIKKHAPEFRAGIVQAMSEISDDIQK